MASYDTYFRKLNFQGVGDSIQQMKDNETSKLLNPLEQQSTKIQENINNLTATTSNMATTFGTITSTAEGLGVAIGGKDAIKLVGKGIKGAISKAKGNKEGEETDLEPTMTQDEFGNEMQSTEPYGSGEGDIELTDVTNFSSNGSMDPESKTAEPDGNDDAGAETDNAEIAESDPSEGQTLEDTTELDDVGDEGTTVADDAAEVGGEVAADVGEAAADVGVEAGLETAASVAAANTADTFGVGAIVGAVLAVAGAVVGIVGAVDESQNENEIDNDENKQAEITEQEQNIKSNIAKSQFVGANVMPSLSSAAGGSVTSGAF